MLFDVGLELSTGKGEGEEFTLLAQGGEPLVVLTLEQHGGGRRGLGRELVRAHGVEGALEDGGERDG